MIHAFENEKSPLATVLLEEPLTYNESSDFNDFWDESFGEFGMRDYSYTASEILFNVDYKAYETECKAFTEAESEVETGEE